MSEVILLQEGCLEIEASLHAMIKTQLTNLDFLI